MATDFKQAVAIAVGVLCEAFNRKPSDATFRVYEIGLNGLTPQQIETATGRAIRTCRFMPVPAELRKLAGEMTIETRTLIAWEAMTRAVEQHGSYASVVFDDPVLSATIRNLGGWHRLCQMPSSEYDKWLRKDFERVYAELFDGERPLPVGVSHGGILEGTNRANGYQFNSPIEIETGLPALPQRRMLTDSTRIADMPAIELKSAMR